jgi:hypothetical protein
MTYMFFETLFIQDREALAGFNFFKGRLANIKWSCSTSRNFSSIEFSSIFLENTALAANRLIEINYLPIKNSGISFESVG